jgi:hypothetical protein
VTGLEDLINGEVLSLPEVTLVCVDTAYPELALRAVRHCMQQINFGAAVLVTCSDHHLTDLPAGLTVVTDDTVRSVADYSRFIIRDLLPHVKTSHCLVVQWDGFVVSTSSWEPRFLEFDYIGHVIPSFPRGHRVGNGGFSLRSRRLLEALQDPDITELHPEDRHVSCTYRDMLEQRYGIRYADEATAQRFSAERRFSGDRMQTFTFGLHGIQGMYWFMPEEMFRRYAAGIPPHLFGGTGTKRMVRDAVARGDGQFALFVLQQRRKRRKSFFSGIDLWLSVWWTLLRNRR